MFRFTIRDVLWLTVVAAVGIGWWKDQHRIKAAVGASERTIERTIVEYNQKIEMNDKALQDRLEATQSEWELVFRLGEQAKRQASERDRIWKAFQEYRAKNPPKTPDVSEMQAAVERSAELGSPQPKPLP